MSKANRNPIYPDSIMVGMGRLTTAKTDWDGATNTEIIVTAGEAGTRVDIVKAMGVGTTAAAVIKLLLHNGTDCRLIGDFAVAAGAPTDEVISGGGSWSLDPNVPLLVPSGWTLRAAVSKTATFNVFAFGGHF